MTIYKTDGSGNWFKHLFTRLRSIQCPSVIADYRDTNLRCTLDKFHAEKHYDAINDVHWCYGDEYFGD